MTLNISDNLAAQIIAADKDPSLAALEALAVEGYRTQHLTESEVREMLCYENHMQVHALLAEHDFCLNYTSDHLQQDIDASNKLHAERTEKSAHPE